MPMPTLVKLALRMAAVAPPWLIQEVMAVVTDGADELENWNSQASVQLPYAAAILS